MNKKIVLIIASLILLIIIFIGISSVVNKRQNDKDLVNNVDYNSEPQFLDEERKAHFGLASETKAQIVGYDDGYEIYKIIKDDSEIE